MALDRADDVSRFWSHVDRSNECWEWTGHHNRYGYGRISIGSRLDGTSREVMAHRYSWELHYGPINDALVLHRCDNRKCVRPDHLFLGTNADNTNDMVAKGRVAKGEQLPQAKLTEADVRRIREMATTMTHQAIADLYGVRQPAISRIVHRKRWGHVD